MNQFIVQSHRGGGALAPENTLESFVATWDLGLIPEADLRTTKDGVIVAFHDENFSRVVKDASPDLQKKGVRDLTFQEVSTLDVGSWQGDRFAGQRVCSLEQIFALMRDHSNRALYLDVKDVQLSDLSLLVHKFEVAEQVILAAPDEWLLRAWKELVPTSQSLLWMGADEDKVRERLQGLRETDFDGITQLQIHVEAAHTNGEWHFSPSLAFLREVAVELEARGVLFQTLPWLCAAPEVYRTLARLGSHSFASDYPEVALRVLNEWAQSQPLSLVEALQSARETKALKIGGDVLSAVPQVFRDQFGSRPAVVIADATTFEIAGRQVCEAFEREDHPFLKPFIFTDPALHADYEHVLGIENSLRQHEAIPVAVGSGVINDLVKLAAHHLGRPYMCVATAASMDGYTAFGASITQEGSKQTFNCPAPVAVVGDLRILTKAPPAMTASGYADLMAKVTAGADWILADALGVEAIDPTSWRIVQGSLREVLADPRGIAEGAPAAIERLSEGLMLGGFAMQWFQTSRPASGAEHQFSHLWDMQHHTHENAAPSHGFKVGIGTLAVTALYEYLFQQRLDELDIDFCCSQWPSSSEIGATASDTLGEELAELGRRETEAKYIGVEELRQQLELLKRVWPALSDRLKSQLIPFQEAEARLRIVGAPFSPEQIGITRARLRQSFYQSASIRRRFTVLDLAVRTCTLDAALDHIFGPEGRWSISD